MINLNFNVWHFILLLCLFPHATKEFGWRVNTEQWACMQTQFQLARKHHSNYQVPLCLGKLHAMCKHRLQIDHDIYTESDNIINGKPSRKHTKHYVRLDSRYGFSKCEHLRSINMDFQFKWENLTQKNWQNEWNL